MSCLTNACPPPRLGSRRAHCGGCHNSFSGLTAFDRHQTLDGGVHCLDPETRGLVQRPDGVWRLPGERPEGLVPLSGDARDGLTGAGGTTETGEALHGAHGAAQ